jgi:hypothetical protein
MTTDDAPARWPTDARWPRRRNALIGFSVVTLVWLNLEMWTSIPKDLLAILLRPVQTIALGLFLYEIGRLHQAKAARRDR